MADDKWHEVPNGRS